MNEYQSKFTGEEIDELLQKAKNSSTNDPTTDDSALVTCYVDLATLSISNESHTYLEIMDMIAIGKTVNIQCDVNGYYMVIGQLSTVDYINKFIYFNVVSPLDFGDGMKLYYFSIEFANHRYTALKPYILNATAMGG